MGAPQCVLGASSEFPGGPSGSLVVVVALSSRMLHARTCSFPLRVVVDVLLQTYLPQLIGRLLQHNKQ
eukprot:1446619-Pyramimonas_sp.AAC.1